MQLSKLKTLTADQCWRGYLMGKVTHFECMFRDFLAGAINWPQYKPEDIVKLRERLGLTQEGLAALLKVSPKSVLRWEAEGESVPSTVHIALCTLDRLGNAVFDLMKGECSLLEFSRNLPAPTADQVSDTAVCRLEGARHETTKPTPERFDSAAVSDLQHQLHMTRQAFAQALGVSQSTIDKWKSGAVEPSGSALTLLKILWQQGATVLPHNKSSSGALAC